MNKKLYRGKKLREGLNSSIYKVYVPELEEATKEDFLSNRELMMIELSIAQDLAHQLGGNPTDYFVKVLSANMGDFEVEISGKNASKFDLEGAILNAWNRLPYNQLKPERQLKPNKIKESMEEIQAWGSIKVEVTYEPTEEDGDYGLDKSTISEIKSNIVDDINHQFKASITEKDVDVDDDYNGVLSIYVDNLGDTNFYMGEMKNTIEYSVEECLDDDFETTDSYIVENKLTKKKSKRHLKEYYDSYYGYDPVNLDKVVVEYAPMNSSDDDIYSLNRLMLGYIRENVSKAIEKRYGVKIPVFNIEVKDNYGSLEISVNKIPGIDLTELKSIIENTVDKSFEIQDKFEVIFSESLKGKHNMKLKESKGSMNKSIKQWYSKEFPSDDLADDIDPNITFKDAYKYMKDGYEFYSIIDVDDSIVRERIFNKLSELANVDYDVIYNLWMNGDKPFNRPQNDEEDYHYANDLKDIIAKFVLEKEYDDLVIYPEEMQEFYKAVNIDKNTSKDRLTEVRNQVVKTCADYVEEHQDWKQAKQIMTNMSALTAAIDNLIYSNPKEEIKEGFQEFEPKQGYGDVTYFTIKDKALAQALGTPEAGTDWAIDFCNEVDNIITMVLGVEEVDSGSGVFASTYYEDDRVVIAIDQAIDREDKMLLTKVFNRLPRYFKKYYNESVSISKHKRVNEAKSKKTNIELSFKAKNIAKALKNNECPLPKEKSILEYLKASFDIPFDMECDGDFKIKSITANDDNIVIKVSVPSNLDVNWKHNLLPIVRSVNASIGDAYKKSIKESIDFKEKVVLDKDLDISEKEIKQYFIDYITEDCNDFGYNWGVQAIKGVVNNCLNVEINDSTVVLSVTHDNDNEDILAHLRQFIENIIEIDGITSVSELLGNKEIKESFNIIAKKSAYKAYKKNKKLKEAYGDIEE